VLPQNLVAATPSGSTRVPIAGITFEIQRRINQRDDYVRKALADPAELVGGLTAPLGDDGLFVLEQPFRPASFPYEDALHAPAVLTSGRGRRVSIVLLEISAWSNDATALALRPLTGRPDRWSARRIEQYFTLAHAGADLVTRLIREEVLRTMGVDRDVERP
jgi:hypothetical protein